MNVVSELRETARRHPDQPALIQALPGARGYRQLSLAELDDESDRIAAALAGAGIVRGMRTVLMVPPGRDFAALCFALFKLGAVVVLVDPGIGISRLGRCLGEARPEAFIGIARAHLARALLGWARGSLRIRIGVGGRGPFCGTSLAALRRRSGDAALPEIAATEDDDVAGIFFTSGSTGVPKGVVYRHATLAAQLGFLRAQLPFRPGDADLATFPPFALFDPALGLCAVVPDMDASRPARADPGRLIQAIRDHGVVQMFASPAVLDALGRYAAARGERLPGLHRVVSAGAPVRADILERMAAVLDAEACLYTPYGATEALPVTWIESREILQETRKETARGGGTCVGRPLPGVRVEIIPIRDEAIPEWSDALRLPRGEVGEIVVEGAAVTREYFGRPEATRLAKIRGPGERLRHRMGDCGRLDEHGRLWFYGRKSHRVDTPEGRFFPIACEAVLNEHPEVFRSALVAVGPQGGRRPALCVELEAGTPRGDWPRIRDELRERCAALEHSRPIRDLLLYRGSFPVDRRHNAKIDREALGAWARKRLA